MSEQPICPRCETNPLPPRCRVCEDCLVVAAPQPGVVGEVAGEQWVEDEAGQRHVAAPRRVVLACGHVVESDAAVGSGGLCPKHRQVRTTLRVWDGREQPAVEPDRVGPAPWRTALDEFYERERATV